MRVTNESFEKFGQKKRVRILYENNLIDNNIESCLETIREKRRKYLHYYSQELDQLPTDAKEVFNSAIEIMLGIFSQDVRDGKIILHPALIKYLKQRDIVDKQIEEEINNHTPSS
jgi:hypothetical protein